MSPVKVTVFEAVNDRRREIFVGVTTLPMHELIARPPETIRHWTEGETAFRSLEFGLPLDEARAFIERYAQVNAREGWTVLLEKP